MADDILDELEDDFDDDMSDLLDDDDLDEDSDEASEEDVDDDINDKKDLKSSIVTKVTTTFKTFLHKILGSTKAIIIVAVSIVVLISIALILWLFVFSSGPDEVLAPQQDAAQAIANGEPIEEEIIFEDIVEFEPFERIALKTSSTMGRVSLQLSFELTDARYRKQIYAMEDRIRKIVMQQVENTTWLELRNPEGKIMLKYNLLQRINAIFPKATVRNVYFTFFIMQ